MNTLIEKLLSSKSKPVEKIVQRLLIDQHITMKEATTLLTRGVKINVESLSVSSGAIIASGDVDRSETHNKR